MAIIEIAYTGDFATQTPHPSGKSLVCTQTGLPEGVAPEAYSPMQLLCIASASCTMSSIGYIAHVHGFSVDGMKATIEYTLAEKPKRLKSIHLVIDLRGHEYSPKEKKFLEAAIGQCPVMHSLSPEIEKVVEYLF